MAEDRAMSEFVLQTNIRQLRTQLDVETMPPRQRLLRSLLSEQEAALLSLRVAPKEKGA
jgi:hypothetical protein